MKPDFYTLTRPIETRIGQLASDLRSIELETELTAIEIEMETLREEYTLDEIRASVEAYRDAH